MSLAVPSFLMTKVNGAKKGTLTAARFECGLWPRRIYRCHIKYGHREILSICIGQVGNFPDCNGDIFQVEQCSFNDKGMGFHCDRISCNTGTSTPALQLLTVWMTMPCLVSNSTQYSPWMQTTSRDCNGVYVLFCSLCQSSLHRNGSIVMKTGNEDEQKGCELIINRLAEAKNARIGPKFNQYENTTSLACVLLCRYR